MGFYWNGNVTMTNLDIPKRSVAKGWLSTLCCSAVGKQPSIPMINHGSKWKKDKWKKIWWWLTSSIKSNYYTINSCLVLVPHRTFPSHHYFTPSVLFQLLGCHSAWPKNPSDKIKLNKKIKSTFTERQARKSQIKCITHHIYKLKIFKAPFVFVNYWMYNLP